MTRRAVAVRPSRPGGRLPHQHSALLEGGRRWNNHMNARRGDQGEGHGKKRPETAEHDSGEPFPPGDYRRRRRGAQAVAMVELQEVGEIFESPNLRGPNRWPEFLCGLNSFKGIRRSSPRRSISPPPVAPSPQPPAAAPPSPASSFVASCLPGMGDPNDLKAAVEALTTTMKKMQTSTAANAKAIVALSSDRFSSSGAKTNSDEPRTD
uniref:Uncharacterized protein n=1 Tax=Oryza brachyantha TaxID=4533 RepID=J3MSX6_ORYBR